MGVYDVVKYISPLTAFSSEDDFSSHDPTAKNQGLDTGSNDIIDATKQRAAAGAPQVQNEMSQGIDQSGLVNRGIQDIDQRNAGLGGNTPAGLNESLQKRSQRIYGNHLNDLQQKIKMQAPLTAFDRQNQASKYQLAQLTIQAKQSQNDRAQYYDQMNARNQAIQALFSAGGLIGGGYAGKSGSKGPNDSGKSFDYEADRQRSDQQNGVSGGEDTGNSDTGFNDVVSV